MNARRIDDKPQERESPVRHAHAVEASRHGRASQPGYLGLPAEEEPDSAGTGSGSRSSSASEQQEDRSPKRSAGGRARARGARTKPQATAKTSSKGSKQAARPGARKATRAGNGKSAPASGKATRATDKGKSAASKVARAGKKTASEARKGSGGGRKGSGGSAARKPAAKRAGGSAKAASASIRSKVAEVAEVGDGAGKAMRKRARKEAIRLGGSLLRRALGAGSRRAGQALTNAGERGVENLLENVRRLPIQRSIDVAVPPEIAWEQWMELRHLPEGAHRLAELRREGDALIGRIDGLRGADWNAEVIDEREQESFAWRSTERPDSAGLATFHPLGERLTRIELTLDIRPEDLGEAARLVLRVADRRVEEELRRFKADAELLNPDVYEELLGSDGEAGGEQEA